eukprot:sb/3462347/
MCFTWEMVVSIPLLHFIFYFRVTVLKKVDKELPDVAVASSGPRFTADWEILPYSILGSVSDYKQATAATGYTALSKAPQPVYVEPCVPDETETSKEGHALQNWEKQLKQHSKQMSQLSQQVGRSPSSLLMNRTREYRMKQEERGIIDRAIPALDRGKGYHILNPKSKMYVIRVGSEFWSQPQYIGDPDSAVVMTLNRSEQGQFPEMEKIGLPNWSENMSQGHLYPWKRNKFFEKRRKELGDVITEQEPFNPPVYVEPCVPDETETSKEGHALQNWEKQLKQHSKQMSQLSQQVGRSPSSLLMNRGKGYHILNPKSKMYVIRVGSEFWSQPQYIGDPDSAVVMTLNRSEQGQFPEMEKIGLPNWSENMSQGHLYPWKRNKFFEKRRKELGDVITEQEPFNPEFDGLCIVGKRELAAAKPITPVPSVTPTDPPTRPATPRCEGKIETGPKLEINGQECKWGTEGFDPTVVRMLFSSDAGSISNQQMTLKNTGTTAIFFAWKRDFALEMFEEKDKIEAMLEKRQIQYNMSLLVEELVRGIHSPPPPAPPTPPGPSVEERFAENNPYLHYQSDYYSEAESLWAEVAPEGGAWDETLASLRKAVLAVPLEEQEEKLEKFTALREKMTEPRRKPNSSEVYDLCYGCLRAAVDNFEMQDKALRTGLGIGERVHIEEPPPIEPDTTSEKTASALMSPAPDSKKGKKTADGDKKKDAKAAKDKGKPASKGGKKSEAALIPDDEEPAPRKEWVPLSDPVLNAKNQNKTP